jgi:hypothetical protein
VRRAGWWQLARALQSADNGSGQQYRATCAGGHRHGDRGDHPAFL